MVKHFTDFLQIWKKRSFLQYLGWTFWPKEFVNINPTFWERFSPKIFGLQGFLLEKLPYPSFIMVENIFSEMLSPCVNFIAPLI